MKKADIEKLTPAEYKVTITLMKIGKTPEERSKGSLLMRSTRFYKNTDPTFKDPRGD